MSADGHFQLLFNISENICSLAVEAKASPLAAAIRPLWQQYTNTPLFECPIVPVSIKKKVSFIYIRSKQ